MSPPMPSPLVRSVEPLARGRGVDLAFAVALVLTGLYGFGRAYGGFTYLLVGGLGVLLGAVLSVVTDRLRAPAITVAAATVIVFFALGGLTVLPGPTVPQDPITVVPTVESVRELADAAIRGWSRLLTVLPPAGRTGNLMAIPYLLGLVATVTAYAVARRVTRAWAPLGVPVVVLALSILFGTDQPASLLIQGGGFAALWVGWYAARVRRVRRVMASSSAYRTLAGSATVLVVALAGGLVTGPHLPLANARDRQILRDHVEPPFDPRAYPSPLSQFRRYALPGTGRLRDTVLFTADGVPAGALIRIATMDAYDGTVWSVSTGATGATSGGGAATDGSGAFQRVGERIPTTQPGTAASVTVRVGALGTVWMPEVGVVTQARFDGEAAVELGETFRYNRATGTAVAGIRPAGAARGLRPGDGYRLDVVVPSTAVLPTRLDPAALAAAAPLAVTLPDLGVTADSLDPVKAKAADLAGDQPSPYLRARALEKALQQGYLSDGAPGQQPSDAGHYLARLDDMLGSPEALAGDAEQYAALMGIMLRGLGIPSRVVLGVRPPSTAVSSGVAASSGVREIKGREIKGRDITAWVEVGLQGVGWVPMFPTPVVDRQQLAHQPRPLQNPQVKDPPKVVPLPPSDADVLGSGTDPQTRAPEPTAPNRWGRIALIAGVAVGGPILVVLLIAAALIAVKARRRARRRRSGTSSTRIAAGWWEIVDLSLDVGTPAPPPGGTRRETAALLAPPFAHRDVHSDAHPDAEGLARRADAAVFAPGEPGEDVVLAYWAEVDTMRVTWLRSLSFVRRARVLTSFRSLTARARPARAR